MYDRSRYSAAYLTRQKEAMDRLTARAKHYKWKQIALFGAGLHTQRLMDDWPLQAPGLQILCILDDKKNGTLLNNVPVVAPADIHKFPIQALVISSDAYENALYEKARGWGLSIPVVRFYTEPWPGADHNINRILNDICALPSDLHDAGVMTSATLAALARYTRDMVLTCSVETGSGKTTLLFSHLSRRHLVFSMEEDNKSITNVKNSPLYHSEVVEWIEGPTQLTLPKYVFTEPLDFALIDGPHAYPFPDMEYFYIYPHLRSGALLVVDDIHIPNITNMFNFLKEEEMFEMLEVVESTAFFRRTGKLTFPTTLDSWWLQGYNRKHFSRETYPHLNRTLSSDAQAEIKALEKHRSTVAPSHPRS